MRQEEREEYVARCRVLMVLLTKRQFPAASSLVNIFSGQRRWLFTQQVNFDL